jgi:hypothetical protein
MGCRDDQLVYIEQLNIPTAIKTWYNIYHFQIKRK